MTANDWIQLTLYFVVLLALAIPLGRFMAQVMSRRAATGSPAWDGRSSADCIGWRASPRTTR